VLEVIFGDRSGRELVRTKKHLKNQLPRNAGEEGIGGWGEEISKGSGVTTSWGWGRETYDLYLGKVA